MPCLSISSYPSLLILLPWIWPQMSIIVFTKLSLASFAVCTMVSLKRESQYITHCLKLLSYFSLLCNEAQLHNRAYQLLNDLALPFSTHRFLISHYMRKTELLWGLHVHHAWGACLNMFAKIPTLRRCPYTFSLCQLLLRLEDWAHTPL